jgi:hypothetical protein
MTTLEAVAARPQSRRFRAVLFFAFAFAVMMALATGTEAPATSIAQLGQLDNRGAGASDAEPSPPPSGSWAS